MSFFLNFPLFIIILSLMTAVTSSLLKEKAARVLTLALAAVAAVLNLLTLAYTAAEGKSFTYLMGHYPHPWGNELKFGILEPLFAAAFAAVLFLSVLGGKKQLDQKLEHSKGRFYYVLCDLVLVSLTALVYTNDIFTGYVFIEICTLSSCGLLLIRQNGRTILASVRYMMFSLIGSGLFLFGVIFLYSLTGHLLLPNLKESIAVLNASGERRLPLLAAVSLITIGISVKSGLAPFHLWMADTYGAALPSSSGILSGLVSKGYAFFLIKLVFDAFGPAFFYTSGVQNILFAFGVLGILLGSVGALRENNIFRMNAYSSAAQIGYIYMGIGLSATMGIEAALFQILTHALTKPAIFLASAGLSDSAGGAKKFHNLQGTGFMNPFAGVSFSFEAFSMIGLPFTMGFISKYLFGMAAFDSTHNKMIPTLIALALSTILNTLYFARTILRIYNTPKNGGTVRVPIRQQKNFFIAGSLFALANLFFGIFARPFIAFLADGLRIF